MSEGTHAEDAAFKAWFDEAAKTMPVEPSWQVIEAFRGGYLARRVVPVEEPTAQDELRLRPTPEVPSDQMLEQIASDSIIGHWGGDVIALANADQREVDAVGYRAVWRHGCDTGMVAP